VRDYPLRDRFSDLPFLHTAVSAILGAAGFSTLAQRFDEWVPRRLWIAST